MKKAIHSSRIGQVTKNQPLAIEFSSLGCDCPE